MPLVASSTSHKVEVEKGKQIGPACSWPIRSVRLSLVELERGRWLYRDFGACQDRLCHRRRVCWLLSPRKTVIGRNHMGSRLFTKSDTKTSQMSFPVCWEFRFTIRARWPSKRAYAAVKAVGPPEADRSECKKGAPYTKQHSMLRVGFADISRRSRHQADSRCHVSNTSGVAQGPDCLASQLSSPKSDMQEAHWLVLRPDGGSLGPRGCSVAHHQYRT